MADRPMMIFDDRADGPAMEIARMRRHELTDKQWATIQHLFPPNGERGEQWKDHRTILNGMLSYCQKLWMGRMIRRRVV